MTELDPFDLPEWLGEEAVTWASDDGLGGHLVAGHLTGPAAEAVACDLLAVDEAWPRPVVAESDRTRVHQAWRHGQVVLLDRDGRLTLAAPGTAWSADRALDALTRLARAVGADPARWSARLGLALRQGTTH